MFHVLAIDQGTTSPRAIVFRADVSDRRRRAAEFPQHFPASGWVEHDPEDIWTSTIATCREAMRKPNVTAKDIAAIGITNQRETTGVGPRHRQRHPPRHRLAGPPHRRYLRTLKAEGQEPAITAKTGLIIDPYFSGTKVAWILDHVPGARARAERGELMFGTVDCYLLWRLTGGKVHATDATNASRTLLFNIHTGQWDDELLKILRVPRSMLPEVKDCSGHFGDSAPELFGGAIAISGIAGDQQAATIGQACFTPGMIKSTYGTGCFALLNTGATPVLSNNKLLTTIAYQFKGQRTYALEGSIFVAGSAVQWLRDGLGIIKTAHESDLLTEKSDLDAIGLSGAGLCRLRGALLESARARRTIRPHPQHRPGRIRPCRTGERLLPDPRSVDRDARRLAGGKSRQRRAARRRRHGRLRLDDATPRRSAGCAGRSPGDPGNHGIGCGLSRGARSRRLSRTAKFADTWRLERRFKPAMSAATRERKLAGWARAVKGLLASDEGEGLMHLS